MSDAVSTNYWWLRRFLRWLAVLLLVGAVAQACAVWAILQQRRRASMSCGEAPALQPQFVPPRWPRAEAPLEMYRNVPSAPNDDAPIVDGWRQGTGGFLLSYPRSGNHLVRVAVEFLAERFTLSAYSWENRDAKGHHTGLVASRIKGTALADRIPMSWVPRVATGDKAGLAKESWNLWKIHAMRHDRFHQVNSWYFLIYVIRNPAEAISSELKTKPALARWATSAEEEATASIVQNTRVYQQWKGPKMMMRYEELLADPAGAVKRLGRFLRVSPQRVALCAAHASEIFEFAKATLTDRKAVASGELHYGDQACSSSMEQTREETRFADLFGRAVASSEKSLFYLPGEQRIPLPADVWHTVSQAGTWYNSSMCPIQST